MQVNDAVDSPEKAPSLAIKVLQLAQRSSTSDLEAFSHMIKAKTEDNILLDNRVTRFWSRNLARYQSENVWFGAYYIVGVVILVAL